MSWQLAAFGLLALALIGGFAWWERSHTELRIPSISGRLSKPAPMSGCAGEAIINYINSDGYLNTDLETIRNELKNPLPIEALTE